MDDIVLGMVMERPHVVDKAAVIQHRAVASEYCTITRLLLAGRWLASLVFIKDASLRRVPLKDERARSAG